MMPANEDNYIFKRDYKSMVRLNYNHWLQTQLAGYLLHPKISIPRAIHESEPFAVADIGTGTGIFLVDLARALPKEVALYGFDNSSDQFPYSSWLPRNIHLQKHDVFKTFPAEYLGIFDVVHIRAFITLLSTDKLGPFIENMKSLLKPGGIIQWFEPDMTSIAVRMPTNSNVAAPAMELSAYNMRTSGGRGETSWVPKMGAYLEAQGFEIEVEHRIAVSDSYRQLVNLSRLLTIEDRLSPVPEQDKFMTTLKDEIFNHGATLDEEFLCVIARRR